MWDEEKIKQAKKKIAEAEAMLKDRWKGYSGDPDKAPGVKFVELKRVMKKVIRIMTS